MLDEWMTTPSSPREKQQIDLDPILIEHDPMVSSEKAAAFLVGGHDLAFEGLRTLLIRHGFNIVGVGKRLGDVDIPAAYGTRRFLIIVDVADGVDPALDDILVLRRHFPQACVVALLEGFQKAVGLLPGNFGANAILDRNVACEALMKALNVVMSGYGVLSPIARFDPKQAVPSIGGDVIRLSTSQDYRDDVSASLSDRELQIIGCIADGESNKVIARRFLISEATVKIHVRGILRKVNARNRTQAAVWALHRGFGSSAVALD